MRLSVLFACAVIGVGLTGCGPESAGGEGAAAEGPATGASVGSGADGGATALAPGGGADGGPTAGPGTGSADAGTATANGAGGGSAGGSDTGAPGAGCDELLPAPPAAPSEYRRQRQDLNVGVCAEAESDGTGHIALRWQNLYQPHDTRFQFIDSKSGAAAGSYDLGARLRLIGQASGFVGGNCLGGPCLLQTVVLGPTGQQLQRGPSGYRTNGYQANDPTGGMVLVRFPDTGAIPTTALIDAIDASGAIRWTRVLPDTFSDGGPITPLGVDRRGNVLVLWRGGRYGPGTWAGVWFDHDGRAGPVFPAPAGGLLLAERVGAGLFLSSVDGVWLGQFEPFATSMSPPPAWLAARPHTRLHVVHGGRGYAVLPLPETSPTCEEKVDVISRDGQFCGSSAFTVGGGACTTESLIVGYDGTVVQQLPREREAPCRFNDHECDCTYRYWPGYFR